MGYLVIDQIRKEIANNFGNRSDMGSGRIDTWIDMSHMRIARLKDWEELHLTWAMYPGNTGVPDTDRYLYLPIEVNIREITSIRRTHNNATPGKLDRIEQREWDEKVGEARYYERGEPFLYMQWESSRLELFRIPDITYELEVRLSKWPDSVALLISTQGGVAQAKSNFKNMDDAIIFLSTSIGFNSYGRSDKAKEYFDQYRAIMKEAYDLDEEDYDTVQAAFKKSPSGAVGTRGYDDPFVRSIR